MNILKNRTVLGLICIVLSLVICFGLTPLFNGAVQAQTDIVRVTKDIKSGDLITPDMVTVVKAGGYNLPADVLKQKDNAVGKYAKTDLYAGDYILQGKLSDRPLAEFEYLTELDGSRLAISVTIKSFALGLSGKLEAGDIVTLVASDYGDYRQTVMLPELQYVKVLAATDGKGYDKEYVENPNPEDEKALAKELSDMKKNVIIIFADLFCPVLSTVMPHQDPKNRTLGALLSKPSIKQHDILSNSIPYPKQERIAVLGYKNGDNIFTYSEFLQERIIDLFTMLRQMADYVIVDCSSVLTEDGFSTIALECADEVIRLYNADLKSFSYYASHLPLLADSRFKSENHIKALSNVKAGQEENVFKSVIGNIRYVLPYVKDIERQYIEAALLDNLSGKEARKYDSTIKQIVKEVLEIAAK